MVDIILAETASVELTRNYNFVERQGRKEFFVGVVELQRHFAVGHTFAVFGACKMTSCMLLPRKDLALCSPSVHLIASATLDFPHPLGPIIAVTPC